MRSRRREEPPRFGRRRTSWWSLRRAGRQRLPGRRRRLEASGADRCGCTNSGSQNIRHSQTLSVLSNIEMQRSLTSRALTEKSTPFKADPGFAIFVTALLAQLLMPGMRCCEIGIAGCTAGRSGIAASQRIQVYCGIKAKAQLSRARGHRCFPDPISITGAARPLNDVCGHGWIIVDTRCIA